MARDLQISEQTIYVWRRQDRIDRGPEPGLTSAEKAELADATRRIAELEVRPSYTDQGTQCTSWAFTRRAIESGLVPSMGPIGECFDDAVIEPFWSRMQVELLDRRRWKTRVELANVILDYLEASHNRQRRHSALGMLIPIEFEARHQTPSPQHENPATRLHETRGRPQPPEEPVQFITPPGRCVWHVHGQPATRLYSGVEPVGVRGDSGDVWWVPGPAAVVRPGPVSLQGRSARAL